jgi:hypothetical protein
MMSPADALDQVAALLSAASTTEDRETRVLYIATARARLDKTAEKLRELRWILEDAERVLARSAEVSP